MTAQHALALAEDIVASGFASYDRELDALLDDVRRTDVDVVLVDIVADRTAPTPVRERALGRMLMQLSRRSVATLPMRSNGRNTHDVAA